MNNEKTCKQLASHIGPCVISSADAEGRPNVALFGSVRPLDENHLAVALGDCRTLANLRENGRAVCLFYREGETILSWQGARLYLEVIRFEKEGELFESLVAEADAKAGRMAARMLRCAVVFRITDIRPLIAMGA